MNTTHSVTLAIQREIKTLMDRVMERVLQSDPFIKEQHHAQKPLYAALVPDEIFKGSHFERRFVTPFGGVWEKLAQVVANEVHGECVLGKTVNGTIAAERLRRIQEVLNNLEHSTSKQAKATPNWQEELTYIKKGKGSLIPVSVVCDIYIHNIKNNECYAFELKAPLPNSDQTKVSKEKLFKLLAMNETPITNAYYALPYNPYGQNKADYKWSFPRRWFDMCNDPCVLIGDEFWDFIGGEGTYKAFIKEVNELGLIYREKIYREYLGIEPPADSTFNYRLQ
ncbi:MAG: TdeIII family type II restriction endonuclease [Thiofilum sp.]|uniref:TdeIII family type II restriction endonuclease n=1 Tax=Thiofilum sp. TaxID=2212733 RepID=UPI0025EFA942|nr:TdeIII family type II restriction endonuclease [Thiofilum sp.]MBK8454224.1 TdeIII family type II restriction endonuclease [Thiofilum sp.]